MKTTAKEYEFKSELNGELARAEYQAGNVDGDFVKEAELARMQETLEADYFSKLDTVNVHFYIGSRSYYENVVKIGKRYYKHGQSMTQGRGYNSITEIVEITKKNRADMIDDSYYY